METTQQQSIYNQSGAKDRSVDMLSRAVARLVNRCDCMNLEMRLKFLARFLDNLVDGAAEKAVHKNAAQGFSLDSVMRRSQENPDEALTQSVALLTHSLRNEQGLDDNTLRQFYESLFAQLVPSQQAAA